MTAFRKSIPLYMRNKLEEWHDCFIRCSVVTSVYHEGRHLEYDAARV